MFERKTPFTIYKATHLSTKAFGIIMAISGMPHGFFELLQGNKDTPGFIIQNFVFT